MKLSRNIGKCLAAFTAMFLLVACGGEKRPETIYLGGTIYTGNPDAPLAEAVGTLKSRIIYVGDANGIIKDTHPSTKLIDLKDDVMYPGLINTHVGALATGIDDEAGSQIEASAIEYAKLGWTAVHAFNVEPENVRIAEDLAMSGKLPVRVYNVLKETGFESLATYGPGVSPGGLVETRAILLDVEKPLTAFSETGDVPTLRETLELALKNHVQLVFEIPNQKIDEYLDVFESALKDAAPDADPRWRIVKTQNLSKENWERANQLGIAFDHALPLYPPKVPTLAFYHGETLDEFTTKAAYIGFREGMIGTIEVGKLADFTIMSGDVVTLPKEELISVEPVMTIIGGAQAWPRPAKELPAFLE